MKLFYLLFFCFLGSVCSFYSALAQNDEKARMNEQLEQLREYNRQQEENRVKLRDYQRKHSDLVPSQKEEYWDLAWHARLADYGDSQSQFIIAQAYEYGRNVEVNPKKAVAFYKKAAEQGHIEACMRLGSIYTENIWLQKDEAKARQWYMRAAQKGYVPAQIKLSEIYEAQEEYAKAYEWRERAMRQMFPHQTDLTAFSPELKALEQKKNEAKKEQESEDLVVTEEILEK